MAYTPFPAVPRGADGGGGATVHNDLTGRSAAEAHPQSAITGLTDDLAAVAAAVSRVLTIQVTDPAGPDLTTGDGKAYYIVPAELNGRNITNVALGVTTVSSSGAPQVQLARVRAGSPVDVCSTRPAIDANENTSYSGTAAVVNTSNDDLATGDILRVDVDAAGTGARGLQVIVSVSA